MPSSFASQSRSQAADCLDVIARRMDHHSSSSPPYSGIPRGHDSKRSHIMPSRFFGLQEREVCDIHGLEKRATS